MLATSNPFAPTAKVTNTSAVHFEKLPRKAHRTRNMALKPKAKRNNIIIMHAINESILT